MKHINLKTLIGTMFLSLFFVACSGILDEKPRNIYKLDYFKTKDGILSGITSEYATLRRCWGDAGFLSHGETGTDEATWGASGGTGNFKVMDISGQGEITPNASDANGFWGNAFTGINTASGCIENALSEPTITNSVIAEAKFFRAFWYFYLVQIYGGVPLDLGAGELKFCSAPIRKSVRNTVPEVYTKGIFPDLLTAVQDLPDNGRVTGGVTKTLARLYLAKAYLTYGWWLENPNNIPTYPACNRIDPDGHDAQWYFQEAYDIAVSAINSPASFGLCSTFYDVNIAANDRNKEMLLYADHTQFSSYFNGGDLNYSGSLGSENIAAWMMTWNYTSIASYKSPWVDKNSSKTNSVQREAVQYLGRPWVRMAPPHQVFSNTFADKTNDSRYDGTFVTTYRGNWNKAGVTNPTLYNANNMTVAPGDAILTFLDTDPGGIVYPAKADDDKSAVGAGELTGRADYVIAPNRVSRIVYPNAGYKIGTYRTDNGTGLGIPNGAICRPFPIAKFSELYFIAAEADVKGANPLGGQTAYDLINVIRARAGIWRWDNSGNVAKIEDNSAAMTSATPLTIDIDYILAERSREFYGEGIRWYDLVRTQTWSTIAHTFTICGTGFYGQTPTPVTRLIDNHHYLRPIPQGQLDALDMTLEEKAAYQNPGY